MSCSGERKLFIKKNWVLVAHKTQTRHPIDKFVSNFKEEGVVFFKNM
jgi:hypothetical protein